MAAAEATLAVLASVALHVEYSRGVEPGELFALTGAVAEAITRTSSRGVVVDEVGVACASGAGCIDEIAARTGAEWIVRARVIGVSSRIRLVLVAETQGAPESAETKVDLQRTPATWPAALDAVVRDLVPPAQPALPRLSSSATVAPPEFAVQTSPTPTPSYAKPWPWLAIGAGVLAGGIGAVFGVRSADARAAGEAMFLPDEEFSRLDRRARDNGIAANVLFGVAGAGILAGVGLLVFD